MRYLTENNDYNIIYWHIDIPLFNDAGLMIADLEDKKTGKVIRDSERFYSDLEKCLMKLGKRLIKQWQNLKK